MPAVQVRPGIHWIGVNDRTTDLFEGVWPITQEGVSYNSYLVTGVKTALIDLVKDDHAGALLDQIGEIVEPASIDYVIINHMEPDHTGAIKLLRQVAPDVTFIASAKAAPLLDAYFGVTNRVRVVEDGESLDLGGTILQFHMIPFVHWPETMVTYEPASRVVFSCDAFGGYGALGGIIFDDQCTQPEFYRQEALRYYANIVAKYSRPVLKAIDKLSGLAIDVVAPSHGLVWRQNPATIVDLYKQWAEYGASGGEPGVTLVYGSMYGNTEAMMNAVATGVSAAGVPVAVYDAARTHPSYILPSVWTHAGVLVGAPTYEGSLFPPMVNLLHYVAEKRMLNKKVAWFGSYSWSGGAQKAIEGLVAPLKWEWVDTFQFLGTPTKDDLHKGEAFGRRFGEALTEK